jgi:sensor histidine kinase YesM
MLIQPLIENAILHGLIADQQPDGHLKVEMHTVDDTICIRVSDNGLGILNSKSKVLNGVKEKSMGLASIQERVEILNNQEGEYKATFSIKPGPDGKGTEAIVCLSNKSI